MPEFKPGDRIVSGESIYSVPEGETGTVEAVQNEGRVLFVRFDNPVYNRDIREGLEGFAVWKSVVLLLPRDVDLDLVVSDALLEAALAV